MDEMLVWTAYHEAGHAVRAWWLRRPPGEVRIDRERPGDGFCEVRSWSITLLRCGAPVTWATLLDDMTIWLAGPLAEARHRRLRLRGLLDPTGSADAARAWEALTLWDQARHGCTDATDLSMHFLQEATKRLLRRPKAGRAVEALAAALLEESALKDEDAERIIAAAYGRQGFPRHWRWPAKWSTPDGGCPVAAG
jgi:hypothetical protein